MVIDKGACSEVRYSPGDDSYNGSFTLDNSTCIYHFRLYGIEEIVGVSGILVKFDIWDDKFSVISDRLLKFRIEMSTNGMPIHYNDNTKNVAKKSFLLSDLESDIMHLFVMKILPKILLSGSFK